MSVAAESPSSNEPESEPVVAPVVQCHGRGHGRGRGRGRPAQIADQDTSENVAGVNTQEMKATSGRVWSKVCLLYTSPSPRDRQKSRMPSSA